MYYLMPLLAAAAAVVVVALVLAVVSRVVAVVVVAAVVALAADHWLTTLPINNRDCQHHCLIAKQHLVQMPHLSCAKSSGMACAVVQQWYDILNQFSSAVLNYM